MFLALCLMNDALRRAAAESVVFKTMCLHYFLLSIICFTSLGGLVTLRCSVAELKSESKTVFSGAFGLLRFVWTWVPHS